MLGRKFIMATGFAICMIVICTISLNLSNLNSVAEKINTSSGKGVVIKPSDIPEITLDDHIYKTRSAFVIPEYKLVFFTFPKVACSEWKRMFMRINGNTNWCITRGFNAHHPKQNMIKVLNDYDPEVATAMMTSPAWTKAAILREPKERVLSAFLDKAVKEDYYVKKCCEKLSDEKEQDKCKKNEMKFDSFLHYVTKYPKKCFDVHWEPQITKIDSKWWPYIDIIGYQDDLQNDAQNILKHLTSARDDVSERTAWDRYGVTGWGASNGCENRTHSFLEENTSTHKLDTGDHLMEWYTAETEKLVEENWGVEWTQARVNFKRVKLFSGN